MGGHHHHDPEGTQDAFDPGLRRTLNVVAVVLALATLVGLLVLWPGDRSTVDVGSLGVSDTAYAATVVGVDEFVCPGEEDLEPDADAEPGVVDTDDDYFDGVPGLCVEVTFRLDQGPDEGEERTLELYDIGAQPELSVGDGIVVPYLAGADEAFRYSPQFERERGWPAGAGRGRRRIVDRVPGPVPGARRVPPDHRRAPGDARVARVGDRAVVDLHRADRAVGAERGDPVHPRIRR